MSFGVVGTITPLVDLWLDAGRLPDYMRAVEKGSAASGYAAQIELGFTSRRQVWRER